MARCNPYFHIFSTLLFVLLRITGRVSGYSVDRAVGGSVTFTPDAGSVTAGTTSIIWKQDNAGSVTKVIEWDRDDGIDIPNPKFKTYADLNSKTGELTLTNLQLTHSGKYIIEINSRAIKTFNLTVMQAVTQPEITKEPTQNNPNAYYLHCKGSKTNVKSIIWKNAAGKILKDYPLPENPQPDDLNGGSYTAKKGSDPNNSYYTCTFKNPVSEKTSEPFYEKDLFPGLSSGAIAGLIVGILLLLIAVGVAFCFRNKICETCLAKKDHPANPNPVNKHVPVSYEKTREEQNNEAQYGNLETNAVVENLLTDPNGENGKE